MIKDKIYILGNRISCYECEGELDIKYASYDRKILEQYNKWLDGEILEIPILKEFVTPYNYIVVEVKIYNNHINTEDGVYVTCEKKHSNSLDIKSIKLNSYYYREWNTDAEFILKLNWEDIDTAKELATYLGNEIYNIRKNSDKNNNVDEVNLWLENNFKIKLREWTKTL